MNLFPRAIVFPLPKVVVDRGVRRKVLGQQPPGTTRHQEIENSINDVIEVDGSRPIGGFGVG